MSEGWSQVGKVKYLLCGSWSKTGNSVQKLKSVVATAAPLRCEELKDTIGLYLDM